MNDPTLTPNQTRHPELVSGSIEPHLRIAVSKANGVVSWPNNVSGCADKWIPKQVQGDEAILMGSAEL